MDIDVNHLNAISRVLREENIGFRTLLCALVFYRSESVLAATQAAEEMGVTTGAMTTLMDRLEVKGMGWRVPVETDRRKWTFKVNESRLNRIVNRINNLSR